MSDNQPFMAIFRPQKWEDDYAVDTGKRVEFDATKELLSLPLERIRSFRENDYDSDELAENLPERKSHRGPFEVDTDLDGWLEAHGIEGRSTMTQAQLDALRVKFGLEGK